jgi:GNAT superfamily N-acetyltransferase
MNDSTASVQQLRFSMTAGVPSAARALIWEIFFGSRQRGVDWLTHFPWVNQDEGTYCLMLSPRDSVNVVATLVLRIPSQTHVSRYAMLGMVCVDEKWRGQGLATQLLSSAITFSTDQRVGSLILWTTQPSVYVGHGFKPDREVRDTLGQVTLNPLVSCSQIRFGKETTGIARSLPPFGNRLIRYESDLAQMIVVETANSLALAEWTGSPSAVLDLIEAALPPTHNLNAPSDSPIFGELERRRHVYTPLPCATRMVHHMDKPIPVPYISVLERI